MKPGKLYKHKPRIFVENFVRYGIYGLAYKAPIIFMNENDVLMFLHFGSIPESVMGDKPNYPIFLYKKTFVYPLSTKINKDSIFDFVEEVYDHV